MGRINCFEDIDAWKNTRRLVTEIYKTTNSKFFVEDFGLKDQIRRASVSVMSNIAEGFERDSKKEFIRFLHISRGSAAEVRSLLYVAYDLTYITQQLFESLFESISIISKQLYRLIEYLRKCQDQPANPPTRKPANPQTRKPANPLTRKPANPQTPL